MTTTDFNAGWKFRAATAAASDEIAVTLPHDAMIGESRGPRGETGSHGGYYPGGRYVYSKTWTPPAGDLEYSLLFEGVYGRTEVRVGGQTVATTVSGYREFIVPLSGLTPGAPVEVEVEVDNSEVPNSRWYTGSGIYRNVWLEGVGPVRIARDGIQTHTTVRNGDASVHVSIDIENKRRSVLAVDVTLESPDGRRVTATAEAIDSTQLELSVPRAQLWSAETPHLHTLVVELTADGATIDERRLVLGVREVQIDTQHGLQINGKTVLLRGACVHHDSGVLGAATHRAAEYRRARILRDAGFNAVRSSHNPLSRDFLDACDELGLYVLDELTDVWFLPKTPHDLASQFDDTWRDDARSMVAKDRNHASVIMYSIGNEIAESGTERGIEASRDVSAFIQELDPTRRTTLAINFLLNVMAGFGRSMFDASEHELTTTDGEQPAATSTVANVLANRIGKLMQAASRLPQADKFSRDAFAAVDVAGYNYAWGRYRSDARRYPDRIVLGTESMPGDITRIWPIVERLPNVIGDFVWTGWDYIGESGIGSWSYGADSAGIGKPYPEHLAGCGLIDINGHPGAALLLSRAAWNQLDAPQIAVRPLNRVGEKLHRVAWRSTDAVQSWSWLGCEGRAAEIEVYSTDDQVELILNGRSLGRRAAGVRRGFISRFRVPYEPGELTAVGYRGGVETSRSSLHSAGPARLSLRAEEAQLVADGRDLAFVWVEFVDEQGIVESNNDDSVALEVTGPAVLSGYGSAATATKDSFAGERATTFQGRALAVLRSTGGGGDVVIKATSTRLGTATANLRTVEPSASARLSQQLGAANRLR